MVWSRSGIERKRLPTVDCSVPKAAGCITKAAGCHFWDQGWQNCCRVLRVTVFRLVRVEVIVVDVDCVVEDVILVTFGRQRIGHLKTAWLHRNLALREETHDVPVEIII